MPLGTLKKMGTGCATIGILFWVAFVYYISSDLGPPWKVGGAFFGFASLGFWYEVLNIHHKSKDAHEDGSKNAPIAPARSPIRPLIYSMVSGALTWAMVVYNISLSRNVGFEWLVPADPMLLGIQAFLSPHVWLAAAYLNIDNDFFRRKVIGTRSPDYQGESPPKKWRNMAGWALLILAAMNWGIFVPPLTLKTFGLWDLLFCLAGLLSPCFLLTALYLNITYEEESRRGCCSETVSN